MERGDLDVDRVPDFTVGMVSGATGQVIRRNFSLNLDSLMLNKETVFPLDKHFLKLDMLILK